MDNLQVPEPDAKRARVDDTNGVEQPASPMDVEVDTTMLFATHNEPGALMAVLAHFRDANVNIEHMESQESREHPGQVDFLLTLRCTRAVVADIITRISEVSSRAHVINAEPDSPLDDPTVPWFPTKIAHLDRFADRILSAGGELESDHPGFSDPVYRERRQYFADIAIKYRHGEAIPRVEYTESEIQTWNTIFNQLRNLYATNACKEHIRVFPLLEEHCNFRPGVLPQLEDVSNFLQGKTGFRLRPVAGLLSSRDFLAGLAFRVFHSTQYIRHPSRPLYTPEPDICHELLGHAPLFADPSFAAFSQEIGLASLGAPDEWILKLATLYWFTIEYGMCREDGELKAYGAGLLSSFGELKYCIKKTPDEDDTTVPEHLPFVPEKICVTEYPVTKYQPRYFVAESFEEAKEKVKRFADTIPRRFTLHYDPYTMSVDVVSRPRDLRRIAASARGNVSRLLDAIDQIC